MSPEAQRIAIAEACGNRYHKPTEAEVASGSYYQYEPDYLNDLNAMHEAEKYAAEHLMDADQWEEYGKALQRIHPTASLKSTDRDNLIDYYDFATLMTELSAVQRAEAFLRTLGLWKE